MKPKIALTTIVSASTDDEYAKLQQMLESVKDHVDAIYIQLNAPKGKSVNQRIRTLCEQYTVNIQVSVWKNNFAKARNELMAIVPEKYDWIIWLDADDTVENPENIRPSLAVMPENIQGVFILYEYQRDVFGNVIVSHWNTRAVRNNGTYSWKSSFDDAEVSVHETLIANRSVKQVGNNEWKVVHHADDTHFTKSLLRNIELLEGMAQRQNNTPKGVDPRILFYLGSHSYDAHDYKRAREMFIAYLQKSGWPEERAEAHVYMGKLFMMHTDYQKAKIAFLQAMGEYPDNPGAYLGLGKLEAKNERWENAAKWFKRGVEIKRAVTTMVRYNYDWELYSSYAEALSKIGGKSLPEALKMAEKALKLRPYDEISKNNRDIIQKLIDYRDDMRATNRLIGKLSENETGKILPFINSLPNDLQDSPVVIEAKHRYEQPRKWHKKSIVIFAGEGTLGIWGPWSLESGIGGSEEAVIRLSDELVKLGWQVTVYATPGKRAGIINGVEWRNYLDFNPKDEFDVLIGWRNAAFFDYPIKARKKYLWLHDVTHKHEFTPERLNNLDKIIYVSAYHANRPESEEVPKEKKFISGNGINPADFDKYDGIFERDLHRCIYMSANERGLRVLYDIWPDVKKEVPDAKLDIYYGWQSFDAVNRDNPERMTWKATMIARAKELDGVTEHDRLGQDELNAETFMSGILAYPLIFPEVYAISFIKAVAAGAHAVTSDFAVFKEYENFSTQTHLGEDTERFVEEYKTSLIEALKKPLTASERKKRSNYVKERYSWERTAKQWDKEMSDGGK